jgi:hypothetical protein
VKTPHSTRRIVRLTVHRTVRRTPLWRRPTSLLGFAAASAVGVVLWCWARSDRRWCSGTAWCRETAGAGEDVQDTTPTMTVESPPPETPPVV